MTDSALATRRRALILLLVCVVQFMDVVDTAILNVALPSIQKDLAFTQQSLQWVVSGYLVSYGGLLLLGGRAGDLLGRRRALIAGTTLFGLFSLLGSLAPNSDTLVIARVAQGVGAALMAPAGLSILMTTFHGDARNKALGAWGAMSALGAAGGIFFGGVLSEGPGWRWVLLVNVPICLGMVSASLVLLPGGRPVARERGFDLLGAILVTGGMLLGLHALIEAPDRGWGTARTIGELLTAGALLIAFVFNESRAARPLFPLSLLRIRGIAAADLIQLAAFGGFTGSFFFLTLYTQGVLGYSPIQGGSTYLPVTAVPAVQNPGRRQLRIRSTSWPTDNGSRTGSSLGHCDQRRQRRSSGRQSRSGRRSSEYLPADRNRAGHRRLLGPGNPPNRPSARHRGGET